MQILKIKTKKTANDGGRIFFLEVQKDMEHFLLGYKVTKEGDPIGCSADTETKHLIAKNAIAWSKPQEFDKKYGTLKDKKEQQ
jgi:hypothetical protein